MRNLCVIAMRKWARDSRVPILRELSSASTEFLAGIDLRSALGGSSKGSVSMGER